jgi:predicted dehydrogenase
MEPTVGIIGCGGIARQHVEAYKKQGLTIAAVTDASPDAARKLADEIAGVAVFGSVAELLEKGDVDLISICTPPVAHEEAACAALAKGVHVLCEKPMAFDVASAHRMRDAVRTSKALFMPAFRHRFFPANIAMKAIIDSGRIGHVVLFNNIFCGPAAHMEHRWFTKKAIAGGGCLLDTNSHSVDLFRFLVGEIVEQNAMMHRHFKTTDVEDAGILCVKGVNGAIGAMESGFAVGSGAAFIDIIGTQGQVRFDYFEPAQIRYRLANDADWTIQTVAQTWGFEDEIRHFVGAIRNEHPLSCTVDDGVRCMEVICSVYEK